MKKQLLALIGLVLPLLAISQSEEKPIKLKQIESIAVNTANGDRITKTYSFKDGKLSAIQTSDIVQGFFYNKNGYLDRTVRENVISSWKEVASYYYDNYNRLIKYTNLYDGGSNTVTKTVTFSYEGSRITAITKRSNSSLKFVQYIDYAEKDGNIASETERDLNRKIISNKLIDYVDNDLVTYKGVVGDKSTDSYIYDEKNSAMLLMVKNIFGNNYKTAVLLIASHEREFAIEYISTHNFVKFTSTKPSKKEYSYSYTYNEQNYPKTHFMQEGSIKTTVTYDYE